MRGVVAAITTPVTEAGHPDIPRFLSRAQRLLADGCDGLNVLGTTGEATSFSAEARESLTDAVGRSGLPTSRLLVGVGAAALDDAVRLTKSAAANGFGGALVLPPFYYKAVADAGLMRFFDRLVTATAAEAIPLYLYNFPALSGVTYTPALVEALVAAFGDRIAGLKDSSGDVPYSRQIAAISPDLDVFPSNEANLGLAREGGPFAGCISATANLNSADCARGYREGDADALFRAIAFRNIFDGLPLVPAIKAMVAHLAADPAHELTLPPLAPLAAEQRRELFTRFGALGRLEAPVALA
ncbi:dihydrodipicolinate synthase family protein [Phenylobacterium sp.]|uniref:dihydrodipicolinate synthase family protein n=1 Tax=Phenylobacterium sp. TaxID=1871053 RepID=UPI002FC61B07